LLFLVLVFFIQISPKKAFLNLPVSGTQWGKIVCFGQYPYNVEGYYVRADFPASNPRKSEVVWGYIDKNGVYKPLTPITYTYTSGVGVDYVVDSLGGLDSLMKSVVSDKYIDTFQVYMIAGTDTLIINIRYYNENFLKNIFVKDGDTTKITLPEIDSCDYVLTFNAADFSKPPPATFSGGEISVALAEGVCSSEIKISKECECPSSYTFKVKNADCDTVDCEGINMQVSEPYSIHPDAISALVGLLTLGSYSANVIAVDSDKPIISWEVNPLLPFISKTFIVDYGGNKVIVFPCSGVFLEPIQTYPVEVCLTFAGNIRCCDTIIVFNNCENWFKNVKLFPNIVLEGIINISYELYELPDASTPPLSITVYDQFGMKKMDIMNAIPSQISEILTPNINGLQAGHYYTIFQMGNQIEIRPFVKQ